MKAPVVCIAAVVVCLSLTGTTEAAAPGGRKLLQGKASGNNNPEGDGTSYAIPGDQNQASIAVTADSIARAVAGNKANLAAAVGSEAALTATKKSASLQVFDTLDSQSAAAGGRKLMQGKASGNNNAAGTGTSYLIPGDINQAALTATSDTIADAVSSNKAFLAASAGAEAAQSATKRSTGLQVFDKLARSGRN